MISSNIKEVLSGLSQDKGDGISRGGNGPLISINRLTSKVGGFYEKVRYLVEYKEEHTVRRSAIERVLVRSLKKKPEGNIGLPFLLELVTGGYLPNNTIPEQASGDVDRIINKYIFLRDECNVQDKYVFSLCATEIERSLFPQIINDLVAESFYKTVSQNLVYAGVVPKETLDIQTYIACRRSLLDDDNSMLIYAIVQKRFPELSNLDFSSSGFRNSGLNLAETLPFIESSLDDPLGWRITSRLKDNSIAFSVIREIITKFGATSESIFNDQSQLGSKVKDILNKKYQTQHSISSKSGNRAVGYLLMTKIILAFVLEVPYEKYFIGGIEYFPLMTNVLFHPLLLLVIVKTVSQPGSENTNAIIANIDNIVHGTNIKPIHIRSMSTKAKIAAVLGLLYLILFALTFSFILGALHALHFNIASIVLFLFFLTLVSYFGFRIRYNANKWKVSTKDEGFFSLLWNFFTMPIVHTGQWLSKRFAAVNVLVTVMDFILEAPFKLILGTFDSFISYLRDKKDNPY